MMKKQFTDWAGLNYSEADCIVIAILSHGSSSGDGIKGAEGNYVAVDELLKSFTKFIPTLVGKPKILIIQACRGTEPSMGILEPKATTGKLLSHSIFNKWCTMGYSFVLTKKSPETKICGAIFGKRDFLQPTIDMKFRKVFMWSTKQ